jgi:hypothetical protein
VLFADRAELLACLAADWCERRLEARWWWHALIGDGHRPRRVVEAWLAAPRYVAAALELLTRRGWGPAFVASLHPVETTALLHGVLDAQGFSRPGAKGRAVRPLGPRRDALELLSAQSPVSAIPSVAPWHAWAPEAMAAGLRLDQERLLGLSLTVRRAPLRIFTAAFVEAALAWRPAHANTPDREHSGIVRDRKRISSMESFNAEDAKLRSLPLPPCSDSVAHRDSRDLSEPRRENASLSETSVLSDVHSVSANHPPVDPTAPFVGTQAPVAEHGDEVVRTACGGVFFLLNLGIRLGLYGDFTTPLQPGIALPIWDFVTLVGQRLAGRGETGHMLPTGADVATDPAWGLLAAMAKRQPEDEPGAGFDAPATWRVPLEWLRPFARVATWNWSASSERLRVRHPGGFLVLDVPRSVDEAPEDQAARETALYLDVAPRQLSAGRRPPDRRRSVSSLDRWTGWLLPYIRARLSAAMAGRTARTAGPLLCRQQARVLLTPVHLHAVFSLNALPIEVRLSGLDRDPGWIPAAGRVVSFAFE